MPVRSRRKEGARAQTSSNKELIGRLITVTWPTDGTEYDAIVLSYTGRRQHKILYLDEESTENLELGTKTRPFTLLNPSSDPLIGCDIQLEDPDANTNDETWFDHMRAYREKKHSPFIVKVYAAVSDPTPDEIVGPDKNHVTPKYYRVIHEMNEYLSTINMESIQYNIVTKPGGIEVESIQEEKPEKQKVEVISVDQQPEHDPSDDVVLADEDVVQEIEITKSSKSKSQKTRSRPDVDADPDLAKNDYVEDHLYIPPDKPKKARTDPEAGRSRKRKEVSYDDEITPNKPVRKDEDMKDIENNDVEEEEADQQESADQGIFRTSRKPVVRADKRSKLVSADQSSHPKSHIVKDESDVDIDLEITPDPKHKKDVKKGRSTTNRNIDENVTTVEIPDEPMENKTLSRKQKQTIAVPDSFDVDNDVDDVNHDTASDEETLGWISRDDKAKGKSNTKPQVGDYIALRTETGGRTRNAFVEAYLPATDTHFVAFCDSRGGNLQVKLTKDNHVVYKEHEVDALNRGQSLDGDADMDMNPDPVEEIDDDDTPDKETPKTSRTTKRRGRKEGNAKPLRSSKPSRKTALRREYLGRPAEKEICGRCISIVWPGGDGRVYVALVLGFSTEKKEHQVVYMADHCVETLDLRYREWSLVPREKEPWITTGMIGKRLYVFWNAVYDDKKSQDLAEEIFGENTKVPFEAYVLDYVGEGKYKIIYPATEDTEVRELRADGPEDVDATEKEWDILEDGVNNVGGLPLITWTD